MPKQLTRLTVFVSGTSETEAERAALKRVLEEVSSVLEKTHSITLRLSAFPDTTRPGISTDPQAEINTQVSEYDIYVGLLGSRFGTPTPRAGSGTEEEFEVALTRYRQDRRSVRVMVYFKRSGQDPFAVDLKQLQKVRDFRDGLSTRGVLYRDFRDTPDFIDTVRDNLHHLIIDEWEGEYWRDCDLVPQRIPVESSDAANGGFVSRPIPPLTLPELADTQRSSGDTTISKDAVINSGDDEDDDDLGYLELAENLHRRTESLARTLEQISQHTTRIGEQFQLRTKQIELLVEQQKQVEHAGGSRARQESIAKAKDLVNQAGDDLQHYAVSMGTDLFTFREDARAMIGTLRKLLILQKELAISDERRAADQMAIVNLVDTLTGTRDHITRFQASVAQMPPMTGHFKRARKKVTGMLGELLAEFQFLIAEGKKMGDGMGGYDA